MEISIQSKKVSFTVPYSLNCPSEYLSAVSDPQILKFIPSEH